MYKGHKIAVIVPACNEELLIAKTVETIPEFVDHIIVIDDGSTDRTAGIVSEIASRNSRILFIQHGENRGVGAALSTGYLWYRSNNMDIAVVMNGDNQMDPVDLPALINPLVENHADYTKGNRLITGEAWNRIPHVRYLGNSILTFLTKIVSGYWHVTDSQSGYTAMNKRALKLLPLGSLYTGYGVPNDILVKMNIYNMRVMDVPVSPVYGIGEQSKIRLRKVIFSISMLLFRLFFLRMFQKYTLRDFHPLIFFYGLGFFILTMNIPLIIRLFFVWGYTGFIPTINALAILFCTLTGLQLILFAMLFDMEANVELKGK